MKRNNILLSLTSFLFSFVFVAVIFVFPLAASAQKGVKNLSIDRLPSKEKRWALLIGVDSYGLKGAVNDAKALKNTLVKYAGFPESQIVILTTDNIAGAPTRRNILIELDKLSRSVPADGLFLFAFSGHGKTIENNAFLIPSDGQLTQNDVLLGEISINVTSVKKAVEKMKVKQVLMFIDACRDRIEGIDKGGSSEPLTKAVTRGFSFDEANKSVEAFVILYATRLGEVAYEFYDDKTKQWRGNFSYALVEGLSGKAVNEKGEVTLANLVTYLEEAVPTRSYRNEGKRQIPLKDSNNAYKENELVLAYIEAEELSSIETPAEIERQVFVSIRNSSDINEIRAVLDEYPTSQYAPEYRKRLDKLVWESVKNSRDKVKIQAYLDEFGDKAYYASVARIEIKKLTKVQPSPNNSNPVGINNQTSASSKPLPASEASSLADRALSEMMTGRDEEARKLADEALKINPNLALAIAVRSWAKFDQNIGDQNFQSNSELIRLELERAVKLDSKNAFFRAILIDVYQALGKGGSSVKAAEKVLSLLKAPKTALDYFAKGLAIKRLAYGITSRNEAISNFTKAIELNPKFAFAYFYRSKINYDNVETSKADLLKALEINPLFSRTCGGDFSSSRCQEYQSLSQRISKKGLEFSNSEKYDEAISEFTKAIEIYPLLVHYQNRGLAYSGKKDFDSAIKDFDVVIENSPKWSERDVYFHRAYSYAEKENCDQAIADYTKSIENRPNSSAYNNRAVCYAKKRDYNTAIRDYTKAIELAPNDGLGYRNRANAYENIGRQDLAESDRKNGIAADQRKAIEEANKPKDKDCTCTTLIPY